MHKKELKRILKQLKVTNPTTDEYKTLLERYKTLKELDTDRKKITPRVAGIPPEVLLTCAVGMAQLLVVLEKEKFDVISSKAFGWIKRP